MTIVEKLGIILFFLGLFMAIDRRLKYGSHVTWPDALINFLTYITGAVLFMFG